MAHTDLDLKHSLTGQAAMLSELATAYMEPALEASGISLALFELLSATQATKGQAKQAELAERLGITPPSLCEALKAATQKGLVEQVASPTDGRSKTVRLTNKGAKALDQVVRCINQMDHKLRSSLDSKQVADAIALLQEANKTLLLAINLQKSQKS